MNDGENKKIDLSFDSEHPPLLLSQGSNLSEHLNINNSPVLFGCRTGICGTCLVDVIDSVDLPPPLEDERELLELLAPGNTRVRLACQINLVGSLKIRYVGSN